MLAIKCIAIHDNWIYASAITNDEKSEDPNKYYSIISKINSNSFKSSIITRLNSSKSG